MRSIHIMPLFVDSKEVLAADVRRLYAGGVLTDVAFMFTLVPEGIPPVDKVSELGKRFRSIRAAMADFPGKIGILAQATMGHGYPLASPFPFQHLVRADGETMEICCPFDRAFREYLTATFRHLAELQPDFLMVDDDFRLLTGRDGCFCPLHLAEFNARNGSALTREELVTQLQATSPEARRIGELFDRVEADSLTECAALIRDAVDAVDPAIRIDYCACLGDIRYAELIAHALAGKRHSPAVRINNACYLREGFRHFAQRMYEGAAQIAALPSIPEILDEPDTCPQNRYSTSAAMLHAQYTFSLLEGCTGAKHWITRLRIPEFASGEAYRETLLHHAGFYQEAEQIGQKIRYLGGATPLSSRGVFNFNPLRGNGAGCFEPWSGALFGRMGIPAHFQCDPDAAYLTGPEVDLFRDAELESFLQRGLLLDGDAARKLVERGYSAQIGVTVEKLESAVQLEELPDHSRALVNAPDEPWKLVPLPGAEIDSVLFSIPWGQSAERTAVAPGAVRFVNSSGGRIVVFAGRAGGFSFLNESRKAQLIRLCNWIAPLPCWYGGDAELYLKCGEMPDGSLVTALLNLAFDPLEEILLEGITAEPATLEELRPDGSWSPIPFVWNEKARALTCRVPLKPGVPLLLRRR